ncbi:hypothetical protein DOE59_16605 [Salmonella enterica subsp. diarizonae serovar 48:i:z]|uniref:Uncharacterized protein n=1 Tax=Salmonella enterica subsp. diarizonae serovar 48:i:z TaxID=1192842 RepID=A0A7U5YHI7_SALDZ|nr:hypothetical protein [Salmonella enterica]EAW1261883.1 hypothetical protein [Salmonella enterica subsp. diarizonae]AXC73041.1 hypothetical protein DOE59_16605 [Salmonella enterica subsp. diarizonae serovar 48:i:z]EEG1124627.1 hypothetical protein [Salmonella enterica subsp. diarizonae]EGU4505690.1 hypothetical protein [Salmonella enterica]EKK4208805.1 hypothetical protein [Salmonella enterica]
MTHYTAANIQDILNREGNRSGFAFDALGPYFVNDERLKAMKNKFSLMLENDAERQVKRIPERTKKSINRWFSFLAERYGI